LSANVLIQPLVAFIKSLSDVSQQLLLVIDKTKVNQVLLQDLLRNVMRNSADVELAVYGV
jgi:hypothetical protein